MRWIREVVGEEAIYVTDGGDSSYFGLVGLWAGQAVVVIGSEDRSGRLRIDYLRQRGLGDNART